MIRLLYCPQMEEMARKICQNTPSCQPAAMVWQNFRDGFPDLKIMDAQALSGNHVAFLASMDSPSEIFRQLAVIYELPRLGIRSLQIVLPYFSTGTMERVDEEGEIATASTLARMLSIIPGTISGPAQIIIYDIHALQERFYFSENVFPRLVSAVPLLLHRIKDMQNLAVAFPDEGAWKRFRRMFKHYPLIIAHKIREKNGRRVVLREGDPRGKHVIIVDDLVMTGGTLLKCRQALAEAGAARVSAYVTHGVFPEDSWKRFTAQDFEHFFITDSCPLSAARVQEHRPFEILSLHQDMAHRISSGFIRG
ncbi:MAG: ribose-phosphate diphosphokinase [Desulfonatronovibrionaceae bacterium]